MHTIQTPAVVRYPHLLVAAARGLHAALVRFRATPRLAARESDFLARACDHADFERREALLEAHRELQRRLLPYP